MNRGQLSRRERKARIRFIQSRHLNHFEQQIFDDYVEDCSVSYVDILRRAKAGLLFGFMAVIASMRLSYASAQVGITTEAAIDAFARLGGCLREAEKEESV